MELAFSSNKIHYMKKTFCEVRYQEETAEIIVPDSYPDVASIVDCFASVFLRGKECRNGSAILSGAVKAGALYLPEDGTHLRLLEFYIPFTVRFDSTMIPESAEMIASMKVCSVDTRMINSRKVMLRTNIGCEITVYAGEMQTQFQTQTTDNSLQLKKNLMSVILPVEAAEKTFVVGDTIEVPNSRPPVVQICKASCRVEKTDQKLIGNKAIFKGVLHYKMLYRSDNNSFYIWTQELPYSQYCELHGDYDEGQLTIIPALTGCDVDLGTADAANAVHLTANLLMQCIVSSKFEMELTEDAYCTNGELKPEWANFELECRLDQQQTAMQLRHVLAGTIHEVIDAELYDGYPSWKRQEQIIVSEVPVLIRVFGLDAEGNIVSLQDRTELGTEYPLSDNGFCSMQLCQSDACSIQNSGNGIEIRCRYHADTTFTAQQTFRVLCGGTIEDLAPQNSRKPSVVIKTVQQEQSLWSIAKCYRTTVSAIQYANGIDSEYTQERTTLLIPMV